MINPKVREAALDFIKSQFRASYGEVTHEAYAAECRLFDEHFKGMNPEEKMDYRDFVNWLDNSRMWESDLTVDELWDVFKDIRHDALMEEYDSEFEYL